MTRHALPRPGLLAWASRWLNEAVMGFLALVALATATGSLVFDVSPGAERFLNTVEGLILALFIAEFVVQFAAASDRSAWLRSPWRIVDALCILGPLLSFLPQVSDNVRGAFVFRLLRVGRAVAFGARAGAVAVQKGRGTAATTHRGPPTVSLVTPGAKGPALGSTWPELLSWARSRTPAWYHAANIDRDRLADLAAAVGIPDRDQAHFHEPDGGTHSKTLPDATSLLLWLPSVTEDGFPLVSRNRLLVHVSASAILTVTSFPFDLPAALRLAVDNDHPAEPFPARITFRLLALLRDRYEFVLVRHEEEIRRLEEFRVAGRGTLFLSDAFRLQREISAASADLWRLKGVVRKLADGKLPLPGADAKNEPVLGNILSEIDGLDDEFAKAKDDLKSLMELHMNVTSFEMNKFMKLLAVVGFLGLIPSVAGGLLGMNVMGNPWAVSLGQVGFGVGMGMAISLYVFAIRGWLR
jgi:Mg2+ and Co2+ transporter CorA